MVFIKLTLLAIERVKIVSLGSTLFDCFSPVLFAGACGLVTYFDYVLATPSFNFSYQLLVQAKL